jgi:hypothetical protein
VSIWPFDLLPAAAQTITLVIFYAAVAIGCAWFAAVGSRKPAPTEAREPFRKPARILALGCLLLSGAAAFVVALPDAGPAWQATLLVVCLVAGAALTWTGRRMYTRAADAYPCRKARGSCDPTRVAMVLNLR